MLNVHKCHTYINLFRFVRLTGNIETTIKFVGRVNYFKRFPKISAGSLTPENPFCVRPRPSKILCLGSLLLLHDVYGGFARHSTVLRA